MVLLKKIISISILYFQIGQGKDYVYEYEGKFIGRHLKDTLSPNSWQKDRFEIKEVANIFPKYYILKINNFDDVARNTLDEWIYFLKNSEVPQNYKAKGLKEASEKLRIDQLSTEERRDYERFKESRWIEKDVTETAVIETKLDIAQKLIDLATTVETIANITGLTVKQIEDLRNNFKD